MKRLSEHTTYADLAGRRQPRRYVVAAVILLGLVLVVFVWAYYQRQQARGRVIGSSQLLTEVGLGMGNRPSGLEAQSAGKIKIYPPTDCSPDPSDWNLQPEGNAGTISESAPACVVAGLEEAVAWVLLTRLGYSKPEAADQLVLAGLPWQPAEWVSGLSQAGESLEIQLSGEWPAHPSYRYWVIDAEGQPGIAADLQHCYRPPTASNSQAEINHHDYEVLCEVTLTYTARWGIHQLENTLVAVETTEPASTIAAFFGYQGEGGWIFLGEGQDPQNANTHPAQFGQPGWDPAWLQAIFGIQMRTLPDGWQTTVDPTQLAAIGKELTRYVNDE